MIASDGANFQYLNREGCWADFTLDGLALQADGSVSLTPLPATSGALPESRRSASEPQARGLDLRPSSAQRTR